jgi:hypothetical protein
MSAKKRHENEQRSPPVERELVEPDRGQDETDDAERTRYRRAGTRELQKESEKPEHQEEIRHVWIGKRANCGIKPAVRLGKER